MIHNSQRVQPRKGCGDAPSRATRESYVFRNVYKPVERPLSRARIVFILIATESYLYVYGYVYKPVERGLSKICTRRSGDISYICAYIFVLPLLGVAVCLGRGNFSHNFRPISTMGFGTSTCGAVDFPWLTRRRIIVTRRLIFLLTCRRAPPYAL